MDVAFALASIASFFAIVLAQNISLYVQNNNHSMPKCNGNTYSKGTWIRNKPILKSFHCCGYDDNDYLHDSKSCQHAEDGNRYGFLFQGSNTQLAHGGGHACTCDAKGSRYSLTS